MNSSTTKQKTIIGTFSKVTFGEGLAEGVVFHTNSGERSLFFYFFYFFLRKALCLFVSLCLWRALKVVAHGKHQKAEQCNF